MAGIIFPESVANSLNDITKTHPNLVIDLVREEYGEDSRTNWILRHASRTLLKKGNIEMLALFGYEANELTHVKNLKLESTNIAIGEVLEYTFQIFADTSKVRIEYTIDYVKKNRNRTRKVFIISETELREGQPKTYTRTLRI